MATVGRYGSVNAINIEIRKKEESAANASFESAYRGAVGKPILFGVKGGAPIELPITDVGNSARVEQGIFAAKGVTTVVLSAVVSNDVLVRLHDTLTSKPIDAVRIVLSGDVRLEFSVDEDAGEDLMQKFACFYQSLAADGVDLAQASSAPTAGTSLPQETAPASIAGRYLLRGSPENHVDVHTDGSFVMSQQGMTIEGTYDVRGDIVTLRSPKMRGAQTGKIVGDTIVDPQGMVWEREKQQSASAPVTAQVSAEQIVSMVSAKLPDDVIIKTIQASKLAFDVTPEILVQLKSAGASDAVIRALAK